MFRRTFIYLDSINSTTLVLDINNVNLFSKKKKWLDCL